MSKASTTATRAGATAGPDTGAVADDSKTPRPALPAPGEGVERSASSDGKRPGPTPKDGSEKTDDKASAPRPPAYTRPAFWIVVSVLVIGAVVGGMYWWFDAHDKISTDDAFVSAHITTVSPRVAGHVEQVLVDDNQEVKKGDVLLVLDDRDARQSLAGYQAALEMSNAQLVQAQAQLASAKAQVAQSQADVASAQANAQQAAADQERYETVQKADPRAVSKQQVDQAIANARTTAAQLDANKQKQGAAEAQVKVAQSQMVAAQASIDKARSDVDNANLQLSYTKIYAADDGQVTNRSVEVGNYVTPGQALMALVPWNLQNVWVTANFKETQLKTVHVGQPVKVHVDAYGMDVEGHVQSIQAGSGAAFSLLPPENATGNYVKVVQRIPVKITFDRLPDRRLAPGMSVEPVVDTRP